MAVINRSTIKAIINYGKESKFTNRELSYKKVITNSTGEKCVVNISNIYEKYYDILLDNVTIAVLSEEEYLRYRFKPKLLSEDLYGTKEFHYMLLRLNNITSVTQFDFKEIKVFDRKIIDLLNEIIVIESDNYIDNELEIIKEINE